jgi:hypothetical protein
VLGAKNLAHGVCEMFLKPQDQALAILDVLRRGSVQLELPQLGDVCPQMSHEAI